MAHVTEGLRTLADRVWLLSALEISGLVGTN